MTEKSWFQKYAEVCLVGVGCEVPEVTAIPKVEHNADIETVVVTVDSGAYNTVGPPTVGTHF